MALSHAIGVHPLATTDVIVHIEPNFICRYYGTRDQLLAEGLIPAGLQWPHGKSRACFEDARFTYWLERKRVPGTKGPMSSWVDGDYWLLDVTPKGVRLDWESRQIKIKQRELEDLKQRNSSQHQGVFYRAIAARDDAKYMAFRTHVIGDMTPRKRGRPAKATNTIKSTQSQGASA